MCGSSNSFTASFEAIWMKTDSAGNQLMMKRYGGSDDDFSNDIALTSDGGFAMARETYSFGGVEGIYFLKSNTDGETGCNETSDVFTMNTVSTPSYALTITVDNIQEFNATLTMNAQTFSEALHCLSTGIESPSVHEGFLTYPNPATDKLNFSYSKSIKTIEIYNSLGSKVTEMQVCPSCSEVDLSALNNGIYIIIARCVDYSSIVSKICIQK